MECFDTETGKWEDDFRFRKGSNTRGFLSFYLLVGKEFLKLCINFVHACVSNSMTESNVNLNILKLNMF